MTSANGAKSTKFCGIPPKSGTEASKKDSCIQCSSNVEKQWSEKSCTDVYNAIAIFSSLAEKQWKIDEEKAARYASAAADYATVYETVCKR